MTVARDHRRRKWVVSGFTAGAGVLALSSVAFACIIYTGKIQVTGGSGTSTSVGARTNPSAGLQYCVPPTDGASAPAGGSVTVSVSPATQCLDPLTGQNQLRDGTYDVHFLGVRVYQVIGGMGGSTLDQKDQCYFPTNAVNVAAQQIGTLTVAGGAGSGQYALPANAKSNGPNNRSAVCIREQQAVRTTPSSAHGNSAAVTVL